MWCRGEEAGGGACDGEGLGIESCPNWAGSVGSWRSESFGEWSLEIPDEKKRFVPQSGRTLALSCPN